jgi:MFS family permease
MSYTMVSDTLEQADATRMISRFTLAFAVVPGFGIAIGGLLTAWFNWESCFYFLALFGAFVLYLSTKLPETANRLIAVI